MSRIEDQDEIGVVVEDTEEDMTEIDGWGTVERVDSESEWVQTHDAPTEMEDDNDDAE
jgi:hypothetical protein